MFRRKTTTITRPDRDRLQRATQSSTNLLRWGLFIDELLREVDRARVIDPARVSPDVVTMHSTVRIRDVERDAPEVYTLVYPEDAAPRRGKLSVFTPVGRSLLGRRVRDVLRVETADGVRSIAVEAILYQPEAAQAARRVRTRAALRRARRGERAVVCVLAALVSLVMLPAVVAAAMAWGTVSLWQHLRRRSRSTAREGWRLPGRVPHAVRMAARVLVDAVRGAFQPRARLAQLRPGVSTPDAIPFNAADHDEEDAREAFGLVRQLQRRGRRHVGGTRQPWRGERRRPVPARCPATGGGEGVTR